MFWRYNVVLFITCLCIMRRTALKLTHTYISQEQLESHFKDLTQTYSHISRLYSIGKSVKGRNLFVVEISRDPGIEGLLKPNFKYVGNIHGDETVGRQILINLVEYLLTGYERNSSITKLINTTRIHIFCSMNPDGFETSQKIDRPPDKTGRNNANNNDLNRNFPDPFEKVLKLHQAETLAVMKWLKEYPFVLSANLHGGAIVVNYPYDNFRISTIRRDFQYYSKAPDDDIFKSISRTYSFAHRIMRSGKHCDEYLKFEDGITNGAAWYAIMGGMQDYNYRYTNCFEVTIELSCKKNEGEDKLRGYWNDNKNSLIAYIQRVHMGVKGRIMSDKNNSPINKARIKITDRNKDIYSWSTGEYWRLLLPGTYSMEVHADGYHTAYSQVNITQGNVEIKDFYLRKDTSSSELKKAEKMLILLSIILAYFR